MTEYEDFLVCLYHSKLEWGAIKSEYIPVPWDATIQRDIDALVGFSFFEIEAHVLASKNYFKEQIDFKGIVEVVRMSAGNFTHSDPFFSEYSDPSKFWMILG